MAKRSTTSRTHIGVLISSLEESCQSKLWRGIEKKARELDCNLTVYLSTFQQKDGKLEEHYSVVFDDILSNTTLDGLIIFTGFIAEDIGTDNVEEFVYKCNENFPVVSLAMSFPDIPSLLVDNRSGIYNIVKHLTEQHSYKRIAFIKGPEDHEEAQARFAGYCDALEEASIPLNDALILPGHFSDWSGEEAVEQLLDIRKEVVDAIVCADDETAIGAIKELSRRGILVPENIAVCGFDDEEFSKIITPSLTTARQPFFEMGMEAVMQIIAITTNNAHASLELLQTETTIRQSCGCTGAVPAATIENSHKESNSLYDLTQTMLDYCGTLFSTDCPETLLVEWNRRITAHLTLDFNAEKLLHTVDVVLIASRNHTTDTFKWNNYFSHLLIQCNYVKELSPVYPYIAQALFNASHLVNSSVDRNNSYSALKQSESQWEIRGIAQELVTSFNLETLSEKLRSGAEELGIDRVMVFLYNEPCNYDNWIRPQFVTYITGFYKEKEIRPDLQQLLLPIDEVQEFVAYEQKRNRTTLFYMPLFFGSEQIGIMLMEYNPESLLDLYETIRINVATALKGAFLFEQIEHQSITDELTQLYNRRGFITISLSRLAHLRRSHKRSVLFFIDMDGLKMINDTYGHKSGDIAIKACSSIILNSLREGDIIGRMGGDEFTVLASEVNKTQTDQIITRLRNAFVEFNNESNLPFEVNCSIGYFPLKDYTEQAFELALQQADELLYKEKEQKRKQGISRL